jgi:HK97 family phage portal protein
MTQRTLIDRFAHWMTTKASTAPSRTGSEVVFMGEFQPGSLLYDWGKYSDEQKQKIALTCAWVYADIRGIANQIAQAQLHVYRGADERLDDHPFTVLLNHPNDHMSGMYLLQYTIWWWLLRGRAYWLLCRDQSDELAEIWPLPASRLEPIPDKDNYISGYKYFADTGRPPEMLSVEQIIYFRFPHPFDYTGALSPLSAYALALETDLSAARWTRDNFDKGCTLQMLLSLPKDIPESLFKKQQAEIRSEMEEQRSRYMVVRAGEVTATPVSLSSHDADTLAHRAFDRTTIDRVFGYPEGYWSVQANRANAEAAKASLVEQAIWPLLTNLAAEATAQGLTRYYGDDLVLLPEDIRPRDRAMDLAEKRQHWVVTRVKEARQQIGLEPLGDDRDELLVPELQAQGGGLGNGPPVPPDGAAPDMFGSAKAFDFETCQEDLRRWRSIAARRLKNGEAPGDYDFESDAIPPEVRADILINLKSATTDEEVKAAFAVPFRALY